MEAIALGTETDQKREYFFGLLFGPATGIICIAFKSLNGNKFSEEFYRYPDDLPVITKRINQEIHGSNIYFCSQLLLEEKRIKETVGYTTNVWADLDSCPPERMLIPPSIVLETSSGNYQAFWVMDKTVYDPDDIEELSRRISYRHKEEGADNGWALTKLLRIPFTYNFKYEHPQIVKTLKVSKQTFKLEDFEVYPTTEEYIKVDLPLPEVDKTLSAEDILEAKNNNVSPLIWALFSETPMEGVDWSKRLWRLLMLLHESGFTSEEVYVIARNAACNKYARDGRPTVQLWKDVVRSKVKAQLSAKMLADPSQNPTFLLTDEERVLLESSPPTFIERYLSWATDLTDAAPAYHQAGAIVALSAVISGSVKLPTSYGTIIPNIWVMILGNTTITRKTSTMDLAMDLLNDIDEEFVLATDGSIEGLLTSLSTRPGRSSIFLRDEFSGLLEQMVKKDYMSGMAELLTKLYDCKMQKRVLKSGTVEVKQPRLIIYAGGIKNNVTSILSSDHISSGFVPRFIFITAGNDLSRLRPIGPPTPINLDARTKILMELQNLYDHYNRSQQILISVGGSTTTATQKVEYSATMTEQAWFRYNQIEIKMVHEGVESEDPDITVPMNDRLSKSILKVALLIAASRQIGDEIVVEEIDILRAAKYGEEWTAHAKLICENIGKGTNERLLDRIMRKVSKYPSGIKKSQLMQHMHLSAKDAAYILETLKQRDQIVISETGRGTVITSSQVIMRSKES